MSTESYTFEYTDTFGGEANYAWCKRGTVDVPEGASERTIIRRVKSALGLSGVRCVRENWGEQIVLRPAGSCTIIFID
jgi:hypothetical protein